MKLPTNRAQKQNKNIQNVGHDQSTSGVVQIAVLERGNGTDVGRPSARRKNDLRQRDRVRPVQRRHDPDRGVQHEEDHQRQRDHQAVGHWGPAQVQVDVGAIL